MTVATLSSHSNTVWDLAWDPAGCYDDHDEYNDYNDDDDTDDWYDDYDMILILVMMILMFFVTNIVVVDVIVVIMMFKIIIIIISIFNLRSPSSLPLPQVLSSTLPLPHHPQATDWPHAAKTRV